VRIRLAQPADAPGIQAIYAPVVVETAVSFETEPPTVAEMSARVAETLPDHPWLVLEDEGSILGYSYGHGFGARAAYRWSVETSIYVHAGARGRGAGLALYTALLAVLRPQGYRQAIGGIALPNPASVALHQSLGFTAVGVYRRIGWKLGQWHDVGLWQLTLATDEGAPDPPTPVDRLPPETLEAATSLGSARLRL
jgi:phosphinothricin acetyltransferase